MTAPAVRPRAKRVRRPQIIAGNFSFTQRITIAYLAGRGHSASEIATAIGAASAKVIYDQIRLLGLSLAEKQHRSEVAFVMKLNRSSFDRLTLEGANRDIDPVHLARLILQVALSDPDLLANLTDD